MKSFNKIAGIVNDVMGMTKVHFRVSGSVITAFNETEKVVIKNETPNCIPLEKLLFDKKQFNKLVSLTEKTEDFKFKVKNNSFSCGDFKTDLVDYKTAAIDKNIANEKNILLKAEVEFSPELTLILFDYNLLYLKTTGKALYLIACDKNKNKFFQKEIMKTDVKIDGAIQLNLATYDALDKKIKKINYTIYNESCGYALKTNAFFQHISYKPVIEKLPKLVADTVAVTNVGEIDNMLDNIIFNNTENKISKKAEQVLKLKFEGNKFTYDGYTVDTLGKYPFGFNKKSTEVAVKSNIEKKSITCDYLLLVEAYQNYMTTVKDSAKTPVSFSVSDTFISIINVEAKEILAVKLEEKAAKVEKTEKTEKVEKTEKTEKVAKAEKAKPDEKSKVEGKAKKAKK